jgi:hypothetical protein
MGCSKRPSLPSEIGGWTWYRKVLHQRRRDVHKFISFFLMGVIHKKVGPARKGKAISKCNVGILMIFQINGWRRNTFITPRPREETPPSKTKSRSMDFKNRQV